MHAPVKQDNTVRTVVAVEAACGAGARDPGCKDGPAAFRRHWQGHAPSDGPHLAWRMMPDQLCASDLTPRDAVVGVSRWLAGITGNLAADGSRFSVVGGDHSCAIGTWSGLAQALRSSGPLGLIWIDAHMDMHTPETSHSGAINGMPVAALLGHGDAALTGLAGGRPAIDPRHLCLVGVRSFEPEEIAFAKRHGVRVIAMEEVSRRGVDAVLEEARAIAGNGTAGFGVSLDLDAFDPADAPGVGTPAAGGIRADGFLNAWSLLTDDPACRAIEIVEYNPHRDQAERTAQLMTRLLAVDAHREPMT